MNAGSEQEGVLVFDLPRRYFWIRIQPDTSREHSTTSGRSESMIGCLPEELAVADLMDATVPEVGDAGMTTGEKDRSEGRALSAEQRICRHSLAPNGFCCQNGGSQLRALETLQR